MTRAVFTGLALVLMPLAPAAAVVSVDMSVKASRPLKRPLATAAPAAASVAAGGGAFSIGEIGAALAGLAVLGLVRFGGRQPHSVSA